MAGVAVVVVVVLMTGAAAQRQFSNTPVAISLPLEELIAAASSRRFNSLAQVSQGIDGAEGVLGQHQREAPFSSAPNEEFRITPVKLIQTVPDAVPEEGLQDPDTLTLEADDPFFIVLDDASVSESSEDAADTPPPSPDHQLTQADNSLPNDQAEDPFSVVDGKATVIRTETQDPQITQHTTNTVDNLDQGILLPNDVKIIEQSGLPVNRDAKSNGVVITATDEKGSILQPLIEDLVPQVEQSFDTVSEDVITKSTSVVTPSLEQLQGPADFFQDIDEPVSTETLVTELSTDVIQEEISPTGPSAADFQLSPEILSEETTSSSIFSKESTGTPTPDLVLGQVSLDNLSPAPVPVRISLGDPTLAPIPAQISLEGPMPNLLNIEVSEDAVPEGASESQGTQAPEAIQETDIIDSSLQSVIEIGENSEDQIRIEPHSEAPVQATEPNVEVQEDALQDPATTGVIQAAEATPQNPSPLPETQERLVTELTEAAAVIATDDTVSISEPQFGTNRVSKDTVLLVDDLPNGKGNAPEDTHDPFTAEIENFNPDPPIDAQVTNVIL